MAYLGNPPAEAYTTTVKDSFNGDGSTVAFTMSQPSTTNNVRVVVENVIQDPTVAYTCSGTTLTFTSAPPTGTANIYVVHLGPAVQSIVPPAEISLSTTYTSDLTVQGAFTSQGIDDNATSTAMTLDSSGNLLVGNTTGVLNTAGVSLRQNWIRSVRDGDIALQLNRLTSDGTIVDFRKDGTTVGSIGTQNTHLTIGKNDTGIKFQDGVDGVHPWNLTSNAARDAAIDLGYSVNRFRNLYLSGGVYVGGTGSSNLLDDYEEGTWTPSYDSTSTDPVVTYGVQVGRYTKVGNMVTVWFRIRTSSITSQGTGTLRVANLPFTNSNTTNLYGGFTLDYTNDWNSGNSPGGGYGATNQNRIYLIKRANSDARSDLDTGVLASNLYTGGSANDVIGCGIYMVD